MASILAKDANGANVAIQTVANTASENKQVFVLGSPAADALIAVSKGGLQVYPVRVRNMTPNRITITAATVATTLVGQTPSREGLVLMNDSTATLFLAFGSNVSATDYSVKIGPGAYYEVPNVNHGGQVVGIWDAANGVARITEFVEG